MPEMHRGVAPPWPPLRRQLLGDARRYVTEPLAKNDVLLWPRIAPTKRAHGDVTRGPRTDAGNGRQSADRRLGICARLKGESIGHRLGKLDDRARPRREHAEGDQIAFARSRHPIYRWGETGQLGV